MTKTVIIVLIITISNLNLFAYNFDFFIKNKGQWDSTVLYLYQSSNINYWITRDGITIDIYKLESLENNDVEANENFFVANKQDNRIRKGEVIKMYFKNSNPNNIEAIEEERQITYFNYLGFKDENRRVKKAPVFKTITLKNIYKGIDIKLPPPEAADLLYSKRV